MMQGPIFITTYDYMRIKRMIEGFENTLTKDHAGLKKLLDILDIARVIPAVAVSQDIVTMNSMVKLKDVDTGQMIECKLVYPQYANPRQNKISVLAPQGVAVLGYSVGDCIEWPLPAGTRTLEIDEILYQPEAAGHYNL